MVNLIGYFSKLGRKKILVAGDLMLDTYTYGKARRISPEAPVAVIEVKKTEERPGGAGNTILNLISMGAEVVALGRVGQDDAGKVLIRALEKEGIAIDAIIEEAQFTTPVKNRIVADGQQIVRVDHEEITPIREDTEKAIVERLPSLLKGVDLIALSDYGKGFLSHSLLKALIKAARALNIFIIADPKGNDFTRYSHVDLIKPNLKEVYLAAHLEPSQPLEHAANLVLSQTHARYLMVTRSEHGISLFEANESRQDFPVTAKQVKDVTGAGDTVLAMISLAIANGFPLPIAIQFANIAAGLAIEQFGCAKISISQLAMRLLESDSTNKIFDAEHLQVLQAALADHPCSLISLSGTSSPSSASVNALMTHKQTTNHLIVASIDQKAFDSSIIQMLAALKPIDFILLNNNRELILKAFPKMHQLDQTI